MVAVTADGVMLVLVPSPYLHSAEMVAVQGVPAACRG